MEQPEYFYYKDLITRCMNCTGDKETYEIISQSNDPHREQCLVCERFFDKGRLFLNNVG